MCFSNIVQHLRGSLPAGFIASGCPTVPFSKFCVEFFLRVPRAIFLPDGLMIAHGGVSHDDCLEKGLDWKKLNEDANCLQDFVWARVHEKKKFSYPNRTSKEWPSHLH